MCYSGSEVFLEVGLHLLNDRTTVLVRSLVVSRSLDLVPLSLLVLILPNLVTLLLSRRIIVVVPILVVFLSLFLRHQPNLVHLVTHFLPDVVRHLRNVVVLLIDVALLLLDVVVHPDVDLHLQSLVGHSLEVGRLPRRLIVLLLC